MLPTRVLLAVGALARVMGQCGGASKDPHLHFAHGGVADFRGRDKTYYCFFSGPKLQVNIKTEDATFVISDSRGSLTVDGSYITEVHVYAVVGGLKNKPLKLSVSACLSQLRPHSPLAAALAFHTHSHARALSPAHTPVSACSPTHTGHTRCGPAS